MFIAVPLTSTSDPQSSVSFQAWAHIYAVAWPERNFSVMFEQRCHKNPIKWYNYASSNEENSDVKIEIAQAEHKLRL